MHLNDIAATPAPGRSADTRNAKPTPGDERGFGDLLEHGLPDGKDIGLESDAIAVADRSSAIGDLDMPKFERATQDDLDSEHRSVDSDSPAHAKPIRMLDRLSIDWLSLRMPGRDIAENAQETEAVEPTVPVDGTEIVPSQKEDGMSADRQIAAVQTTRGERTSDEKSQRTPTGTDGARSTQTMRDPAVFAQNAATSQTMEPQAPSAERVDGKRATARMQAVVERLDERADAGAARLSPAQIGSVSVQTILAPSVDLQTPARTVLAALSEHVPEMARPAAATTMQQQTTEPMRILRIQLHPLELGMVTAKLSLQGGAMAVELQTETRDAATRLATDSNDIVKALRGLGIEVDRVTVTQSSSSTTPQADQQTGNFDRGERFAGEAASREGAREQGKGTAHGGTGQVEERDLQRTPDHRGVFI